MMDASTGAEENETGMASTCRSPTSTETDRAVNSPLRSRRALIFDTLIVLFTLAGCATLLWFASTRPSSSDSTSSVTDSELSFSAAPSVAPPTDRMEQIQEQLQLDSPLTQSQFQALHWMVHVDLSVDKHAQPSKQRFALLVLHFATGVWGPERIHVVGKYQDECQWPGVGCDSHGRIHQLTIRPPLRMEAGASLPTEVGLLASLGK